MTMTTKPVYLTNYLSQLTSKLAIITNSTPTQNDANLEQNSISYTKTFQQILHFC